MFLCSRVAAAEEGGRVAEAEAGRGKAAATASPRRRRVFRRRFRRRNFREENRREATEVGRRLGLCRPTPIVIIVIIGVGSWRTGGGWDGEEEVTTDKDEGGAVDDSVVASPSGTMVLYAVPQTDCDWLLCAHRNRRSPGQIRLPGECPMFASWRRGSVVRTSVSGWRTFLIYAWSIVEIWPLRV